MLPNELSVEESDLCLCRFLDESALEFKEIFIGGTMSPPDTSGSGILIFNLSPWPLGVGVLAGAASRSRSLCLCLCFLM